ncbi:hypothetical protein T4A_14425 [Trichinella pseudospiralis]|uniref:Uncharacterized protein n=1 Tax=Trichinella pseudospiralis TaxID=6337 RepID=A0A0V1DQP6_TRIPS|nr:hypothetical protein T4A_14425 [Trichinella pseudospiralis]
MCGEFSLSLAPRGGDCAFCLPNRVGECNLPCSLGRGEEIRAFHEKNREGGGDFAFSSI